MIIVRLSPDNCREYKYWHEYMLDESPSAVQMMPMFVAMITQQFNSTKRNIYRKSIKNGYTSGEFTWAQRSYFLNDIFAINTSKQVRQGKPLGDSYKQFPKEITGQRKCEQHYGTFIGCMSKEGKLVGYITTNFCGELAAASQIMGHGDYLQDGIMVNLWHEFVRICIQRGIKVIVYSRWNDGLDGLKSWKRSVGMNPEVLKEVI